MGLGQIDHTVEAIRGLLLVVMLDDALTGFMDRSLDLVDVAVEEVNLASRCVYPGAAIDPRPPSLEVCHDRVAPD